MRRFLRPASGGAIAILNYDEASAEALLAEAQLRDDRAIALDVIPVEIGE